MVRIIGNLVPEDDFTHAAGPATDFSESMCFNFSDRRRRVCGQLRIENWPNQRHAELMLTLFLETGRVLVAREQATIGDNSRFAVAGGCFEVVSPGRQLRSRYAGRALELRNPLLMLRLLRPRRGGTYREISLDLAHDAVGPMFGKARAAPGAEAASRSYYKQHTRVSGTLRLGERTHRIEGSGLRDHSWGVGRCTRSRASDWLSPELLSARPLPGRWSSRPLAWPR